MNESEKWRVGRKLGRTLYIGDTCIGMVDAPEIAAQIVAAMNAAPSPPEGSPPESEGSGGWDNAIQKRDAYELIQTMVNNAEAYVDCDGETVIGYKIKTGALHKLTGLLGIAIPANLPVVAAPSVSGWRDAIEHAIWLLTTYSEHIQKSVGYKELPAHAYAPEIGDVVDQLRGLIPKPPTAGEG